MGFKVATLCNAKNSFMLSAMLILFLMNHSQGATDGSWYYSDFRLCA